MSALVHSIFGKTLELSLCHETAPYRAETVGKDRFFQDIADRSRLAVGAKPPGTRALLKRFVGNKRQLNLISRRLTELGHTEQVMPSGSEWLLDNQYVIEAIFTEVETDLPQSFYHELPALTAGSFRGYPRIYELAVALLAHADSSLHEEIIRETVEKYQEIAPLTIGELWAIPTMLRLGLLENLRRLADRILMQVNDSHAAQDVIQFALSNQMPQLPSHPTGTFATMFWEALRENDLPTGEVAARLQAWSNEHLADINHIQHDEFCLQAADQVSIGNAITSLRLLGVIDWSKFVESTSLVERILRKDVVHPHQDFTTRNHCRRVIERLSKQSHRTEVEIADAAMTLAQAHPTGAVQSQVGYWLIDDGYDRLLQLLATRHPVAGGYQRWMIRHPNTVYFGLLSFSFVFGLVALGCVVPWEPVCRLIFLLTVIPLSDLAVLLTNKMITRLLPPRQLACYEWKSGIPEECSTFVVVPALIHQPEQAGELLERLEQHYLANPEPQLRFALLTDFTDAATQITEIDGPLIKHLLAGLAQLNARYHFEGNPRFFVFHRQRLWNDSENCWMGWERKRGKLDEFNRLLRGDLSTSYSVQSSSITQLPKIQYVLTLDADTVLPRDAARQMIARLAHPLNHAQL